MGVCVIKILTFFMAFAILLIGRISGTGRHGLSYHFRPPPSNLPTKFHTLKEISASLPVSPDLNVELLKPLAQMEQKKLLPLFVVPQTSLHLLPPYAHSPHLPAVEIPLAQPLVLRNVESHVLAPIGFTVFLQGAFHPFYTVALLAPVPQGTHVSHDTPVIINVLYAVPKLQQFPMSQELLTQVPLPPPIKEHPLGPLIKEHPLGPPIKEYPLGPPIKEYPLGPPIKEYPLGPPIKEHPFGPHIKEKQSPSTPFPPPLKETTSNSIVQSDDDTVIIPLDESIPFENAKESPYLQELRLESLKRQVKELQDQIKKLKRLRN